MNPFIPVIHNLTYFPNLTDGQEKHIIFLNKIKVFEEKVGGFVRSRFLGTRPIDSSFSNVDLVFSLASKLDDLNSLLKFSGFSIAYLMSDNNQSIYTESIANVITSFDSANCGFLFLRDSQNFLVDTYIKSVKSLHELDPKNCFNYRLCLAFNSIPFISHPGVAYSTSEKGGFSMTLDFSNLFEEILYNGNHESIDDVFLSFTDHANRIFVEVTDLAETIASLLEIDLYRIDAAMFPSPNISLAHIIEKIISPKGFGESGTLFSVSTICDVLEKITENKDGVTGLFFSVLHDHLLSQLVNKEIIGLDTLMLLSASGGLGLGYLPLSENYSFSNIENELLKLWFVSKQLSRVLVTSLIPYSKDWENNSSSLGKLNVCNTRPFST